MFNGLKQFYKRYFTTSNNTSIDYHAKTLKTMSKGFLIVGALTSMAFTIPTIFALASSIFPSTIAIGLTIFCALILFLIIDLSIGTLTPFALEFSLGGQINKNKYSFAGGMLLWSIIGFLGITSMYLTYNGSIIPVLSAIEEPLKDDIISLEAQKQKTISSEEARYKGLVATQTKADKLQLESLKKKLHNKILSQKGYSKKQAAVQDSINKVDEFSANMKSLFISRDMSLALDDARNSWNTIIREKKEDSFRKRSEYETKIAATLLIFQILGTISTALFFLIETSLALLKYSEKSFESKPIMKTEIRKLKHELSEQNY
jgi:hypothetical protein